MKAEGLVRRLSFCALVVCAGTGAAVAQQNQAPGGTSAQTPNASQTDRPAAATDQQSHGTQDQGTQNQIAPTFVAQPGGEESDQSTVTIRAVTRRVVVDVVVRGTDGKPVKGLSQDDFKVFENRTQQPVRSFEVHSPENDRIPLPPAPSQLPADTFMNLEATPASGPPVVVLLDDLNTPITDQAYTHEQVRQFLERKAPSASVAIFALCGDLSLVQGFTTDTGKLLAAMHSKAATPRMPAASKQVQKAQITLDAFAAIGRFLAAIDGRKNLLWFSEAFDMMTLPSAHDVEQGVMVLADGQGNPNAGSSPSGATGAANPAPLTPGNMEPLADEDRQDSGNLLALQEQLRKVAIALAVSQTAVYPIDVRGLAADPGFSADQAGPTALSTDPRGRLGTPGMPEAPGSAPSAVQQHNNFIQSLEAAHATMTEIADATGGHAFVNSNGLDAAAEQAVNDGASYYTLVYAPTNLKFDGGLRAIHVVLDKPGCALSYRSAYYAVDQSAVMPAAADDRLAAAMVHGGPDAQGLLFKAQIERTSEPMAAAPDSPLSVKAANQPGNKKLRAGQLSGMVQDYEIRLAILAQQLQMTQSPDGRHHAVLEIEAAGYAVDGRSLGGTKQTLEASMPAAVYERAQLNGMFHSLHMALPVEAASLRLAIFDPGSHRTGSLEVALPLPLSPQANAAIPVKAGSAQR
ncbi:MAG: VWA domain-containing protein [Terracidiphilus sp.]